MNTFSFHLPTRNEAKSIVEKNDAFLLVEREVEGQKVEIYDYRLASISDFVDYNAFELRGITFVQNSSGEWERNILLNKFFNINQTTGWMYDDVRDKKIVRIQNKEDGSIISFVKFENGNIRAKSKTSFISEQATMAQEIYENDKNFKLFVDNCLNIGLIPIFELVGSSNQIVLNYDVDKALILLQIRRFDGTYLTRNEMDILAEDYKVETTVDFSDMTLDELLELKEISQDDIEGWVITFDDGQMAKIKTNKYLSLHGLIGPDAFRENLLVQTILDGNIDDVISSLVDGPKKNTIIELDKKVTHTFNQLVSYFLELRRKYFSEFNCDRAAFAKKYVKTPLFGAVIKTVNLSDIDLEKVAEKAVKEYITKQTNSLSKAKEWINSL